MCNLKDFKCNLPSCVFTEDIISWDKTFFLLIPSPRLTPSAFLLSDNLHLYLLNNINCEPSCEEVLNNISCEPSCV